MKHTSHNLALAGMLVLALSACSTMRGWTSGGSGTGSSGSPGATGTSGTSQSGGSGGYDQQSGSSGTSGTSGSSTASMGEAGAAAMGSGSQDRSQSAAVASISPNATVVSVDVVPRQGSTAETESGVTGSTGSSSTGATGMSAGGDRVYRVTLRMDDGSTRVVTQESTPDFRAGDRVNLSNGMIAH
ncbi:hypothetical protein GCM10027321_25700 [Massilia terrae]|uniref:Lipoprotein n=1 Tax=Massilia terrae TaxID=1811224 RepID=A0ABT2CZA8_9BURK|nr:hypothetical protein [Massilia terrae]MCS0659282.1 hypothetical protein [Massilia terrae]